MRHSLPPITTSLTSSSLLPSSLLTKHQVQHSVLQRLTIKQKQTTQNGFISLYKQLNSTNNNTNNKSILPLQFPSPRLLGLDIGDRFIGISVTNNNNTEAEPLTMIERKQGKIYTPELIKKLGENVYRKAPTVVPMTDIINQINQILIKYQIIGVIVGLPLTKTAAKLDEQCIKNNQFLNDLLQGLYTVKGGKMTEKLPELTEQERKFLTYCAYPGSTKLPSLQLPNNQFLPSFHYIDERYTTQDASTLLRMQGVKANSVQEKKQLDTVCATLILQQFLDQMSRVVNEVRARKKQESVKKAEGSEEDDG